jgi:hypothetical protein
MDSVSQSAFCFWFELSCLGECGNPTGSGSRRWTGDVEGRGGGDCCLAINHSTDE